MRAVYADPAHRKRVSASLHRRHVRRIQAEIAAGTERYPPGFAVLAASSRPEDAKRRGYALYLWRRFRVTVEDVARLYDDQDRRCGWCRKSITFGAGHYKRPARWGVFVDHDHRDGHVRGLLCNRCNRFVGIVERVDGLGLVRLVLYVQRSDPPPDDAA